MVVSSSKQIKLLRPLTGPITSLVPCSVVLPDSLGGARITVAGNYPASSNAKVRIEDEDGHRYWVFREGLYQENTEAPRWFLHGVFP